MSASLASILYLVAGVLFILALRGLSHPTTSRQGNRFGMLGIAIGGGVGAVVARRVPMTAMPQLVAAFHSLVGLAAVLVAAGALNAPAAFGIGEAGQIHGEALIEMTIGVAIGAVTFSGSIIAFLKLDGRMSGKPILLPQRHIINIGLAGALLLIAILFIATTSH